MTQLALLPPAPPKPLTARQQIIGHLIERAADGLTADEIGAWIHSQRGYHGDLDRCINCGRDGLRAMREKALAQRFTRRRLSGRYELFR